MRAENEELYELKDSLLRLSEKIRSAGIRTDVQAQFETFVREYLELLGRAHSLGVDGQKDLRDAINLTTKAASAVNGSDELDSLVQYLSSILKHLNQRIAAYRESSVWPRA